MFLDFIKRSLPDLELSAPAVDCVRCTQSQRDTRFAERWAKYKCCTFQPFVPNFQIGAILAADPLEHLHIHDSRYALQPIGLVASPEFRARYEATPEGERGETFTCAFYRPDSRDCGIWSTRPSECRFYFCLSDARSARRERDSQRMFEWEANTAQMALVQAGFTPDEISDQVDVLNGASPSSHWDLERVKELYIRSWNWARDFDNSADRG